MGMFDVDDLTNKVDVGSQPGTMWSLSSQKPGHGISELRDPDSNKMWQSDGLLPHLINIQFARRTVLTHISLYMDFKLDDSYTPNKIRVYAGTHYHDLVEVRTREFAEASGWKHFVLDKFDDKAESDETDSDASLGSSSSRMSSSDLEETASIVEHATDQKTAPSAGKHGGPSNRTAYAMAEHDKGQRYLACGASRRHAPIDAFLVQICILANHAAGKDTHLRGIRVYGPPTRKSRDKARHDARKQRESRRITGTRAAKQRREREARQRGHAYEGLRRWMGESEEASVQAGARHGVGVMSDDDDDVLDDTHEADAAHVSRRGGVDDTEILPVSRHLQLLSSVR